MCSTPKTQFSHKLLLYPAIQAGDFISGHFVLPFFLDHNFYGFFILGLDFYLQDSIKV